METAQPRVALVEISNVGHAGRPLLYAFILLSLSLPPVAAQATDPLALGEHEVELRGVRIWYLVRGSGPVLLIQPGGAGWGGDATIYIETLQPLEAAHTVVYVDPRGIGRSGRSTDPTLYSLDEYVEDLEALLARTTFSATPFQRSERELATFDIRDQIAEIRASTLIVIGDNDPSDLREGSILLHERIPGAQLLVVPGCGHWPMIERPDLFFPTVLRFLEATR